MEELGVEKVFLEKATGRTREGRGVDFISKKEAIDTKTPSGKFMLTAFGAIAQLEREYILDRQREGIEIARQKGKYKGRKPLAIDKDRFMEVYGRWKSGSIKGVEAMRASFVECLERQAKNVYMGGVAFFCERPMDEKTQKALEEILTNINDETETMEWEDEADEARQQVVDDFMWRNYGRSLNKWEEDYYIEKDLLYLNFAFDDEEEYYRLCDDGALRLLADALNHLLRDRYLAKFTTY